MADKFRQHVQRTAQILREKLWRAFYLSPLCAGRGRSRSAAKASGEGRGTTPATRERLSDWQVALMAFRPDRFLIWQRRASPLTRLASDDARRPLPAQSGERLRKRFASIYNSAIQTAKRSHSRGAKRPRFASPSRTARGDGAVGGARMLARHPWRRVVNPPRAARRPRAPKARRSASQRSTNHQAIDRSGAPRSGQLSLCPLKDRF